MSDNTNNKPQAPLVEAADIEIDEMLHPLNNVRVELAARSYNVHIAEGCHAWLGKLLSNMADPVSSITLVSNRQIAALYSAELLASACELGVPLHTMLIPAGERYKNLDTVNRLYGNMIQQRVDRKGVVLALGGGVIGDLAGFVAATYERGIRFVQVPTSLLAQVDSSIGGKVGVNHPLGKNMIGAFKQPQFVLSDPAVLSTLPLRELRSGLAEIIKVGIIWDEEFFCFLEEHVNEIMRLETTALKHIIRRSCQVKAHVVAEDETEKGLRAILNFGHTTAHAIETYTGYTQYTHGEAVAIGMVVAARLAHAMGMMSAEAVHRIIRLLKRFEMPTHLPKCQAVELMGLMESDKKAVSGKIHLILPTEIGKVSLVSGISDDLLSRALNETMVV